MKSIINGLEIDFWEDEYPYWFHIKKGEREISFTHREAFLIGQTLCTMAKICKSKALESKQQEFGI